MKTIFTISLALVSLFILTGCPPAPQAPGSTEIEEVASPTPETEPEPTPDSSAALTPASLSSLTLVMNTDASNRPLPGKTATVFRDSIPVIYCCGNISNSTALTKVTADWKRIRLPNKSSVDECICTSTLDSCQDGNVALKFDRPSSGWSLGEYEVTVYVDGLSVQSAKFTIIEAPRILVKTIHGWVSGTKYTFEGTIQNIGLNSLQDVSVEISSYAGAPQGKPDNVKSIPLSPRTIGAKEQASFNLDFQDTNIFSYTYKFFSLGKEIPYTLIEKPSGLDEFFFVIEDGDLVRVQDILKTNVTFLNMTGTDGMNGLQIAAKEGQKSIAEFLVAEGAELNAQDNYGLTPLHWAVSLEADQTDETTKNKDDIAAMLIEQDADIACQDHFDETPIFLASWNGAEDIVRLLIEKGADVNSPAKYNITALHMAANEGFAGIVLRLVEAGADVDAKVKYAEFTPLYYAAYWGHTEVARILIEHGANVNAKDYQGHTPLHQALLNGWEITAALIRENGGADK